MPHEARTGILGEAHAEQELFGIEATLAIEEIMHTNFRNLLEPNPVLLCALGLPGSIPATVRHQRHPGCVA